MNLFNLFNKKEELPIQQDTVNSNSSNVNILITSGENESALEITRNGSSLSIVTYEFLFKRDHSVPDKQYRVMGINGSILVNEQELDFIYSEFKRHNRA